MTAPAPKTKFNDLLQEAARMLFSGTRDNFRIAQLDREVAALIRVDADEGWQIKGYIAAIKGALADVHASFRKALRLNSEPESWMRYGQALMEGGWYSDGRDVLLEAASHFPQNAGLLKHIKEALGTVGWVADVERIEDNLVASGAQRSHIRGALELINNRKLSDVEMQAPIGYARTFLKARGVDTPRARARIACVDGSEPMIVFDMRVRLDPDSAANLEFDLYTEMAERSFVAEESRAVLVTLTSDMSEENRHDVEHT